MATVFGGRRGWFDISLSLVPDMFSLVDLL